MGEENQENHKSTPDGKDVTSVTDVARPVPPDHRLPAPRNEPPPPPKRGWIGWLIVLLIAVAIFFVYRYFQQRLTDQKSAAAAKGKAVQAAAITVGQSRTGDMSIYVDAIGTVTPLSTVTVYSQVTGRVMEVHYREGQMVMKGDPLVEIDPRPYQATLSQAQGTLAHDQGLLAEARIDLKRYIAADAQNAIAKQQLEDQEQTVIQYEGTVKADEANVAYDQVQLDYCHIVSPITGRVGLRLVDPGNTIFSGSSSTLVVITELQPITVVFNVSEDDLPQIQSQLRGSKRLEVDAFDRADEKKIESGSLTSLDNQVDTTTGTIKFRAEFQNKNLELFPNQFVNARLLVRTLKNVTLVPSAAVQHNGTDAFVYVVNPDDTVKVQAIKALSNDEQNTAVTGVNAGETLATSGFDRLENGAHVQVRRQGQGNRGGKSGSASSGTAPGGTGAP
jgi:multidrug efflux system membrane fusion protein